MYGRTRLWAAPGLGMAPWWGVIATPDNRRQAPKDIKAMVQAAIRRDGCLVFDFPESDPEAARGGVTARTYLNLLKENLPAIIADN